MLLMVHILVVALLVHQQMFVQHVQKDILDMIIKVVFRNAKMILIQYLILPRNFIKAQMAFIVGLHAKIKMEEKL